MDDHTIRALTLSRRRMLAGGLGALLAPALDPRQAQAQPVFADYPFQLGLAAGDPAPDGFVIWTRLAPDPLAVGYGMPARPVPVSWEVAEDEAFTRIAARGETVARPELAHAVHVEVAGLSPARTYHYRFMAGAERSLAGRARTTPAAGASLARARFGVVGCQHYEQGFYTAHRRLAEEDELDFVFCYGDYIYEGRSARVGNSAAGPQANQRQHVGQETYSLDDYRRRYAQYKMDPDLQASHAAAAWFVTWDDHEIDNNWAADLDQDGTDPAIFRLRQQSAMQAYYEHMPLRRSAFPAGPSMRLYRRADYGSLLRLNLLDTRQYRTAQPCGGRWGACNELERAQAEMLGAAQEQFLFDSLSSSPARWNVLAQQVMMMDLDRDPGPGYMANPDSWGGYRTPRARLLRHIRDRRVANPVVLTGDEHQNYAGELHLDGHNPEPRAIATEFVATSITSGGDGSDQSPRMAQVQAANPQLKFNNSQRGYLLCDVTAERFETAFRVMDRVSAPGGAVSTRAKLVVPNGEAVVVPA
ncbi:alkaline phosphatase [Phenylobacterium sp.]|uniref:alkaline phosphatase D family protein n=1 Tax=Phenylobacterium sp. TaxID=1871053 RepID=UPI00272F1F10|nr:alkaline phosphatase D family protein [Phenylobacterium sp.]MDP2213977.1 alkaline phosphatase D family protein [Phenylobacterium sp.]